MNRFAKTTSGEYQHLRMQVIIDVSTVVKLTCVAPTLVTHGLDAGKSGLNALWNLFIPIAVSNMQ
jgi:hypothetical protein